ncbi:RidA family protein [Paenibacillus chitinolyticus]|uniref:RidA family protein n=2 Tax=Paenibacillus chitinolyticus TaxID=79263 RepID=A0A410WY38_9BACL|nr:RidA family protein [Paenibacillus chitinolyticus]MCY9589991.1 RidA family protein [Paenibacillus chitinolyticus]MCY9596328.1 RidA family protein [Paenibacillus chitinolyticus]QAV19355.1 RidA family protein [Paenibacillus chitinolyticus]
MELLNPKTLTDKVTSVISHVVVTTASKLAFISGQVAVDETGKLMGSGDYRTQAIQAFTNLKYALDAAGADPLQMAKMNIFVVNHRPELVSVIFDAGLQVFGSNWPKTASTYIGVQSLADPAWLIEVDAIVTFP